MYFSYFNFVENKKKNKYQLITNELTTKYDKPKNIIFDKYKENINKNDKNKILTKLTKTQDPSNESLESKISKNSFNQNNKLYFGTEQRIMKSNKLIPIKNSFYDNKNSKILFNNNKDINISSILKKKINNLKQSNINQKYDNKSNELLNKEHESNIDYNSKLLKLKLKDFLITSKESLNKENNFNNKIKKIIHNLRVFNQNNNSADSSLDMPKLNNNINHNCCFSLNKVLGNKKDSYTMTDNINIDKYNSINNNKHLNKDINITLRSRNSFSPIKLCKIQEKSQKRINKNIIKDNIIKNVLNKKNNIINRNSINNQKLFFIENYLNKNTFNSKEKIMKSNKNRKNQNHQKIFNNFNTATLNINTKSQYIKINKSYKSAK